MMELPANLKDLLAENKEAMECFLHLPEDIQSNIIMRAKSIKRKHEMDNLINSLTCNYRQQANC